MATLKKILRRPSAKAAAVIVAVLVILAIFATWITPQNPFTENLNLTFANPSLHHLMGTDYLGRDNLSRVILAARGSLTGALEAVGVGLVGGVVPGVASVFISRWSQFGVLRVVDAMMTFPPLIFAFGLVAIIGNEQWVAMLAIGILFIPSFFRITRAAALGLSKEQYVEESVLLGGSRFWVVRHHVWKKILPTVVVTTAGLIASGLLYVSSLAFLGVGAQPPTPTWGGMLADDLQYLSNSPTQAIWPGLVLLASIWSFNTLADAARDSLGIEPLPATGLKARIARRNARIAGQATNELTQNVA